MAMAVPKPLNVVFSSRMASDVQGQDGKEVKEKIVGCVGLTFFFSIAFCRWVKGAPIELGAFEDW